MNKKLCYIFVLCILQFTFISSALANIPADWYYYGRMRDFTSARSLGLAGISTIIPSPSGLFINPALIGLIKKPCFELSGDLTWISEKRTKELYDQFENTIGEISVADNMFTNTKFGPVAAVYPMSTFGGARVSFGLGYAPVIDYNYYFSKEMLDDFYQLISDYEIKTTGQTQGFNFAIGVSLNKILSVGSGLSYQFGNKRLFIRDTTTNDTWELNGSDNKKGLIFNFGTIVSLSKFWTIGFDFQTKSYEYWIEGSVSELPTWNFWSNTLDIGTSYLFSGNIPTTALAELQYEYWPKTEPYLPFTNRITVRVGVEHTMFNGVNLRYGFGVIPSLTKMSQPAILVSLGLGFDVQSLRIDIGGNLKRRNLTPEDFIWSIDEEKVYQNFGDVVISVSKSF